MDLSDLAAPLADSASGRWFGVYPALVTDNKDPDGHGRIKVTMPLAPDASGASYEAWARLATLMGGKNRGTWFVPDRDDEVLVAFQGGDPGLPFVVGALWNGRDTPPLSMDGAGNNAVKSIRLRNGVTLDFNDQKGQESIALTTPGGNKVVLQEGPARVTIQDSNGNLIRMDSQGVAIAAAGNLRIDAGEVAINASKLKLNAARVECANEIKATTITVDSVVAHSYTPGSGNVL